MHVKNRLIFLWMNRCDTAPRMIGENFEHLPAMAARDFSPHHSGQFASMDGVGAGRNGLTLSRADVTRGDARKHPVLTKRCIGCC